MRNKVFFLSIFALLLASVSFAQVITLTGSYQGKNLYVQNPFASAGVGFCVSEVKINGKTTTDEVNSSAFEIDFSAMQISIGQSVEVKIFHKSDCEPRVLNPEVLQPTPCFRTVSISVDKEGLLKWKTTGECGSLPFIVEQYRWNKWIEIGTVEGIGSPAEHDYEFKTITHCGSNRFRVKQVDSNGKPTYSSEATLKSMQPCVTFAPVKVEKEITFSANGVETKTMFEIFDQFGNIVKKGFGSKVDVSNLPEGVYYLNYDNANGEFIKKK